MPIVTHCPQCRATFNLPDALAGKNAQCSRCKQVFAVPDAAAPPAPVAAAPAPEPRPAPPPAPRRAPDVRRPPARSSGAGWIIALAVGLPLLLVALCGGGLVLLVAVGALGTFYAGTSTPPPAPIAAAPAPPPAPVPDPPNNPVPNPAVPNNPAPNPGDAFVPPAPPPPPPPRDPPPPLKPPVPVEATPAVLAQEKVVKPLPAAVGDTAVGGAGRFLILSLPTQNKLAVFDASAAQVVKYLSFPGPVAGFAAGMNSLIVARADNQLVRYSLKTFEQEQVAPAPVSGQTGLLCMGCASNGPLWVQARGNGPAGGGAAVLVDPATLKEWPADWGDKRPPAGAAYLRASEDGQLFAMRDGVGGEPHTMSVVTIHAGGAEAASKWGVSGSILVPDADGRALYSGCAVYTPTLTPIFPDPPPQSFCKPFLPAVGGPYFARLDYKQWDQLGGDLSFFVSGEKEPFASLKDVEGVSNEQVAYGANRDKLTYDGRIHFLAAAKLVVAIPAGNDRLILYHFDPEAALEKSGADFLVVTSRPPPSATKGKEYVYQLSVKSKKGGVKYELQSGPKGMAIDAAGKLTWTPPADAEAENDVVVSVKDPGGREALHTFRVAVGE